MFKTRPALFIAALALTAGCEARFGNNADEGKADAKVAAEKIGAAAEGKAKEGKFPITAPGFDMKIDLPAGIVSRAGSDSDMLYPGSTLSGMHIEGSRDDADAKGNPGIELRFTTADPPEKVAAWYRAPARSDVFTISTARRDGSAIIISGSEKGDGDPIALRLTARSGGGTDARLTLTDRN